MTPNLKPKFIDKHGPAWDENQISIYVIEAIATNESYFYQRAKNMQEKIDSATQLINSTIKNFSIALGELGQVEKSLVDSAKRSSSKVRESAESLAQGLVRIQKAADFNKLEKYTELLERAATAMQKLADLESNGKLKAISDALK